MIQIFTQYDFCHANKSEPLSLPHYLNFSRQIPGQYQNEHFRNFHSILPKFEINIVTILVAPFLSYCKYLTIAILFSTNTSLSVPGR